MKIAKTIIVEWADGSVVKHANVQVREHGAGGAARTERGEYLHYCITPNTVVHEGGRLRKWEDGEAGEERAWAEYFLDLGWEAPNESSIEDVDFGEGWVHDPDGHYLRADLKRGREMLADPQPVTSTTPGAPRVRETLPEVSPSDTLGW